MCNQILIYILGIVKKINDFDEKNIVDFFLLKIVSANGKACFNFVSQIGSQHL